MSPSRRSLTTWSPKLTYGDYDTSLVTAGLDMLEIGARQLNDWRLHRLPDVLPFCQPGVPLNTPISSLAATSSLPITWSVQIISEKQPVASSIQSVVFISRIKNNLKTEIKELRVRDKHTSNLYWFTFTPRATSSTQKPLCNQNQITNTTHQSCDLEPLKKHTTFGKPHQKCWSWTPQEHTTLLGNTNTVIKEEENRIHLVLQNLKFKITTQSYSTHLRIIQSSFKSWKNYFW